MIIEVVNLIKRYKELTALDNFNLSVKEGEIYGLLGPNGSGKTTAINSILSLLKYDSGSIKVFGEEMSPINYKVKRRIGYVPQEVAVMEELTVRENIDLFCGLYIEDAKLRKKYVEEAMEFVEISSFQKYTPKKLSGGLKRRLNIACGIAHKPELIFFDEPTVAVDPQSRNNILEGIQKLNQMGSTIVYTSHYMEEVEQICTNITIMDKGKNLITGDTEELKKAVGLNDKLIIKNHNIDEENIKKIEKIEFVEGIDHANGTLEVSISNDIAIGTIINLLKNNNVYYGSLNLKEPNLNDVFLSITGKELRDNV